MNSSMILSITTFIYAFSGIFLVSSWIFKKSLPDTIGKWLIYAGFSGSSLGIILRWLESYKAGIGHAPLSNMYESLIFFAWAVILIYFFINYKYKNQMIGISSSLFAFLAMAYAAMSPNINDRIQPLVPALKSNWLIAHVVTCFLGYAAFSIAFGISLLYLVKLKKELDELIYETVAFGFIFLSIGIITGAVWANSAWGSYWSWDPKETWSLVTWLIYAALLHARVTRGWQGKRIAYLSIIGFIAVLFTYFGVNYLQGLHSYGK
ncbi:MAG: cytochrome c biogenesis protein [Desulfobacterales bacterium]|nr:cytochrome c biogenesis protein [Desulfobacterales bacterium]MBF0397691.1 cytochrome c biogenesis protein [Desulfobacterales bacterium]